MPEKVDVSVVICTFNRKVWLSKCLLSLSSEPRSGMEIVVVDGPSNDGTREMLEQMDSEGRLVLLRQPALEGISAARNLGLEAAKGRIVCFIDDDATIEPGWLEAITAPYSDPKVGGVGGPVLDLKGALVMGRNAVSEMGEWYDSSKGQDVSGLSPVMVGCNMSFRADALIVVGGFDRKIRFHQDETDACLRVLSAGYDIKYVDGARVRHAWCEGSYRKDRMLWYLRLRYLWGRNTAYLVSKNFGERVSMTRFLAHKLIRAVRSRTGPANENNASQVADVPAPMSAFGATFEITGAIAGWRL